MHEPDPYSPPSPSNAEAADAVDVEGSTTRTEEATALWPAANHYKILGEIGRGGMGVVYRAVDLILGREVALKTLIPGGELNETRRQRILREARAASKLSHPGIVPVFEVFESGGVPWIAMQLIEGRSLERVLRDHGPGPIEEILEQQLTLASALAAAHAGGVLHRDIKPSNVLISRDGTVRLSDFGLARSIEADVDSMGGTAAQLTKPGGLVGTLPYMCPEQVLGRPLDRRSDIFSLGAVFYEMITGHRAFERPREGSVINAILHEAPPRLVHPAEPVPDVLQLVVDRCLAKDPKDRYQTADELAQDLRALVRVSGSASSVLERWLPTARRRSRRVSLAVIAGAIGIAGVTSLFILSSGQRVPQFVARQVTDDPRLEAEPEISPDGREIAYTLTERGNTDIWIVDTRGGSPLRLTSDLADDHSPTWYPDGRSILYVSRRDGKDGLWRVSHFGGVPELVLPNAGNPAISRDGRKLAFSRPDDEGVPRIFVASLDSPSDARPLTGKADGFWEHLEPSWSPNGRSIVYRDYRDVWIVPLDGGSARVLSRDDPPDRQPIWSPNGNRVYFSSFRDGAKAIWRRRSNGAKLQRITTGTGSEQSPSISADGRRLVYSTFQEDTRMEIVDRSGGDRSVLHDARHVSAPTISPDGSSLVFTSTRENSVDLWRINLGDERPMENSMRLTRSPGSSSNPRFSRDGRWIAYYRVLEGQRDVWVVDSNGGSAHRITDDAAADVHPDWSPDDRRIAFCSDRSGLMQLWVVNVAEGRAQGVPRQLTNLAGTVERPAWSPEGNDVAFILHTDEGSDVWIVAADGSGPPRRATVGAGADYLRWTHGEDGLLVSGYWQERQIHIRSVDLVSGTSHRIERLVATGTDDEIWSFDLTADGRIVVLSVFSHHGDVWALEAESGTF